MAQSKGKAATLRFRVTPEQEEHVKQAAADAGYAKVSEFLRAVVLERTIVAVNGGEVVMIPSVGSTKAADQKVARALEVALGQVKTDLAGEDVSPDPEEKAPSEPAPTPPSESGAAEDRPSEAPAGTLAPAAASSGSEEQAPQPSAEALSGAASVGGTVEAPAPPGDAAAPPAAPTSSQVPPPAAAPVYERLPAGTPIPAGLRELTVPYTPGDPDQPGDYWLGRICATGEHFVVTIIDPRAAQPVPFPAPAPTPPAPAAPTGPHPFDSFGGPPEPPAPAPAADPTPAPPPEDPGPMNERGETFSDYVDRRAKELEAEGRPPVVANQEAAAEWRQQGNG